MKKKLLLGSHSIEQQFRTVFTIIILLFSVLILSLLFLFRSNSNRYDQAVSRIVYANGNLAPTNFNITEDTYFLLTERYDINDENLSLLVSQLREDIQYLKQISDSNLPSYQYLVLMDKTANTLEKYTTEMIELISRGGMYDERLQIMEDIQSVSDTIQSQLDNYIKNELNNLRTLHQKVTLQTNIIFIVFASLFILFLAFAYHLIKAIRETMILPIKKLSESTLSVASGDFSIKVESEENNEIGLLEDNFNYMVNEINNLIEIQEKDAETLHQTELQLLNEQIHPHFIYNTLETIIWLIEKKKLDTAVNTIEALSKFLRLSLSYGKSTINLSDEFDHALSYLDIQTTRYGEILEFDFYLDPKLSEYKIPKMTLQPLIENAIYHGIKPKREKGKLQINIFEEKDRICIKVIDDGVGIDESILQKLNTDNDSQSQTVGYGLQNVRKRLQLFGEEHTVFKVYSALGQGTIIDIKIPKVK